jgi:two-component system sensor histidine kinase BaeS
MGETRVLPRLTPSCPPWPALVVEAAQRIAAGDYAARVLEAGHEESRSIGDAFNDMAANLEKQARRRRELIANAAHELRNPLTNLQGYLEALRDEVIPPTPEIFASLHEEAERLVRLSRCLDVLLEEDAGGVVQRADTDLSKVVRSRVEIFRPGFLRAGIELGVDLPECLPVRVDPDHLAQVLGNLLQNALRYTPDGGLARISAAVEGRHALVQVSNTTDGISTAELAHVFDRFYRGKTLRDRAREGAGIGLAIVKQLVEAAGGRVGADARHGTVRFWFSVPVA